MIKPSIPKGTRDFSPKEALERNYIFEQIRKVYAKYGFVPIETPAMENLATLTGKYGEEGDRLIFKILNSGDYLGSISKPLSEFNSNTLTREISEKALRYDLTVPFARYVVQNRNDITFPFKRYQIQPVWRADRPQKGRYREFYQCDADVIGSTSLISEAEFVFIFDEVISNLGLTDFTVKINHRKILSGIAETLGLSENFGSFLVALDKLDKIGKDKVIEELLQKGFDSASAQKAFEFIDLQGTFLEKLNHLEALFHGNDSGLLGVAELRSVFEMVESVGLKNAKFELDLSLARGLDYYTGAIFEVKAGGVSIGSIAGGGRYDDLTGIFGLPGVSGVGVSFGADRLADVLTELNLFPPTLENSVQVIFVNFGEKEMLYCLKAASELRKAGISCEVYPDNSKIKKQMEYADKRKAEWVCLAGSQEIESGKLTLKNMKSGTQESLSLQEIINLLNND